MGTYVTALSKKFGLKKSDARDGLTVRVLPKDVKKGIRKDSSGCAFAKAVCRQMPGVEGAVFFRSSAWLLSEGRLHRYLLSKKAREEVRSFDTTGEFKEGVYELLPPTRSQKMGRIHERSEKRPGRHEPGDGTIRRKAIHHVAGDVRTTGMPALPIGLIPGRSARP